MFKLRFNVAFAEELRVIPFYFEQYFLNRETFIHASQQSRNKNLY